MDDLKLEKSNKLKEIRDKLNEQREFWELSTGVHELILTGAGSVNVPFVNFVVLKALTLYEINMKISDIEKQYAEL